MIVLIFRLNAKKNIKKNKNRSKSIDCINDGTANGQRRRERDDGMKSRSRSKDKEILVNDASGRVLPLFIGHEGETVNSELDFPRFCQLNQI